MTASQTLPLHDAILHAAVPTFVELGYEKASMDAVAARAGTTKRTVYAHYGSKEELFRAALGRAVQMFRDELPSLADVDHPARELETFAATFSILCTWQGPVMMQRVVMGEAERFPDLGLLLHRDIIAGAERLLANYLIRVAAARGLDPAGGLEPWALEMGSLFLNMTTAAQRFETLLGARIPHPRHPAWGDTPEPDRARIKRTVDRFMSLLPTEAR